MFERIRFARYALKFERAFKDDNWAPVKECFHPDATYTIAGAGATYNSEARGPDAIVALFKRVLDDVDRKFDKRILRLRGLPRVRHHELIFLWKVRYVKGDQDIWVTGETRCRFSDGKIIELRDTLVADEVQRWVALAGTA